MRNNGNEAAAQFTQLPLVRQRVVQLSLRAPPLGHLGLELRGAQRHLPAQKPDPDQRHRAERSGAAEDLANGQRLPPWRTPEQT